MDVRDQEIWSTEARRRILDRRAILFEAALLPNLKADAIGARLRALEFDYYELDHSEEIEEIEAKARKRLEEYRREKKQGPPIISRRIREKLSKLLEARKGKKRGR